MKHPSHKQARYIDEMMRKLADGSLPIEPGKVTHVTIRHDDTCGIFRGEPCDCNPDVVAGKPDQVVHHE